MNNLSSSNRSPLKRKVNLKPGPVIFVLLFLTLLVVGAVSYRGMAVSRESDRWVRHTHEVLENLQDLAVAVKSIESGDRGFALTGNESYAVSCRAGITRANESEAALRKRTVDDPGRQRGLSAPERLVREKIQFGPTIMALRRTRGLQAAAEAIRSGTGQQNMNELERVVRQMQDEELQLLVLRDADAQRRMGQARTVLIFGTILGLLIAMAAAWNVYR